MVFPGLANIACSKLNGSSGARLILHPTIHIPQSAEALTPPHPFYPRVSRLPRRYSIDANPTRDVSAEVVFEKWLWRCASQTILYLWFCLDHFIFLGRAQGYLSLGVSV